MTNEAEQRRLARKARRHARARSELLRAAREILARDGVAGFTVKAIAQAADVSKPSFYYYFPSREHCVEALADGILAVEAATLSQAAYRAAHDHEAAGAVLQQMVDLYADDLDAYRIAWEWPTIVGATDGFAERVVSPRRDQVLDVLAQRLRAHPDPRGLAEVALATAHGLLQGDWSPPRRRALAAVAARALTAALATPASPGG